jgi:hypothetical protein
MYQAPVCLFLFLLASRFTSMNTPFIQGGRGSIGGNGGRTANDTGEVCISMRTLKNATMTITEAPKINPTFFLCIASMVKP